MLRSIPTSDFQALVSALKASPVADPDQCVAALEQVRDGIITGEGPTTSGRVHFSRTLDRRDAEHCADILAAAGGPEGLPVTRAEAEMLFAINAAAAERADGGRFDDLFVKAITQCVMAQAGRAVPPRRTALSPDVPLARWAPRGAENVDLEILEWIASHVRQDRRRSKTLMGVFAALGVAAASWAASITSAIDLAS